jgi:hypothetical protein
MATEVIITNQSPHVGSKDKTVGWFNKTAPELQPAARELLEKYAGIPEDQVVDHVLNIVSGPNKYYHFETHPFCGY